MQEVALPRKDFTTLRLRKMQKACLTGCIVISPFLGLRFFQSLQTKEAPSTTSYGATIGAFSSTKFWQKAQQMMTSMTVKQVRDSAAWVGCHWVAQVMGSIGIKLFWGILNRQKTLSIMVFTEIMSSVFLDSKTYKTYHIQYTCIHTYVYIYI